MKNKELDKLMGRNLREQRHRAKLTQEQLAERLGCSSPLVPKWEAGRKGIGKKILLTLCEIFNVQPYVFYLDERASVITKSHEQKIVYKLREAEKLGVHDQIEEYCDFVVGQAIKRKRVGSKGMARRK